MKVNDLDVSAEEIDGELIAVNFLTGKYFALEGTAIEIWNALALGHEPDAIIAAQSGRAGFEPERGAQEIREFIVQLQDEDMFVPGGPAAAGPVVVGATDWSVPLLEEYDDMAALLKLDPVVDVAQVGWPQQE